ncbi:MULTISPECIES: hypothetical protein [unclassified Archaeoglobus]|uniref:hypothetical protein n=1 Tax=unclassified Archaeoglobus TaxID=2643606 RepID=UPI0025C429BE|nr:MULTISPECIES: hypothetical protein [unclassified Archaeoglobus]
MKKKHILLLILILAPVAFFILTLATLDISMSFQVKKLTSPPDAYFEITEEDFQEYPILEEILEDAEKLAPGESKSYELDLETGKRISNYLAKRQSEIGVCSYSSYTYCFKYGNEFYGANMGTP